MSANAEHAGEWLEVLPTTSKQPSNRFLHAAQYRIGLYYSAAAPLYDALEANGETVTVDDRLGITLAHKSQHSPPHKDALIVWKQAERAATDATVYMGDKGKGKAAYSMYNSTHVPDLIILEEGKPVINEIKVWSPFTRASTHCTVVDLNGGAYLCGNTEERAKHKVVGTPTRGLPGMGPYNHKDGSGYVKGNRGESDHNKCDYRDAINNRKAWVSVIVHETLGGFAPFAARRLRRLGRDAVENGNDATDYTRSYTARSFVPFYSQKISNAIVMGTAHEAGRALAHKLSSHYKETRGAAAHGHTRGG